MAAFLDPAAPFLVQYGDVLTDQDLTAMLRFHQARRATATLLVHQRRGSNSVVSLDDKGAITGFLERPTEAERRGVESPWVFSGITFCEPDLLECIPPAVPCDLPRDVFTRLSGTGRLFGFPLSGRRSAIDSPERLAEAGRAVAQGHYRLG
jgi:mannose-1-phosphate guanylyltransferase/phosphomannomutase